jgi:UDP-N-acetylglucosamine--N-acetylmuramyl-(pentapeptide) pyrophosphoryl-undecaprenol N-acetylglucosamine transferase
VLLVTGASQGARTVNQAMVRVWPRFFARHSAWQLLHLTGAADEPDVRAAYDAARVTATVLPFTLDMAHAIAAADLVVSRAGASTLSELTALGKPSILMPYPYHRDQHQRHNAEVLVAAGAAVRLDDRRESARNEGPLLAALEQCVAPDVLPRMSVAARTFARPRAAEAVADWLLNAG